MGEKEKMHRMDKLNNKNHHHPTPTPEEGGQHVVDVDEGGHPARGGWERARVDAQALANAAMGGTGVPPAVDVLSRSPQRGQPFLLAAGSQERLTSSQHRRGLFAGGSALAVAVALLWALNLRF